MTTDGSPTVRPEALGWRPHPSNRYFEHLGDLWVREEAGQSRYAILAQGHHANRTGTLAHGGLLLSFAEQALGLKVLEGNTAFPQATVQIQACFTDAVHVGELIEAHCRVVKRTGSMAFADGLFTVGERTVGSVTAMFRIFNKAKPGPPPA